MSGATFWRVNGFTGRLILNWTFGFNYPRKNEKNLYHSTNTFHKFLDFCTHCFPFFDRTIFLFWHLRINTLLLYCLLSQNPCSNVGTKENLTEISFSLHQLNSYEDLSKDNVKKWRHIFVKESNKYQASTLFVFSQIYDLTKARKQLS